MKDEPKAAYKQSSFPCDFIKKTSNLNALFRQYYSRQLVFYNKLLWFVSKQPEKDISNVVV